MNTTDSNTVSYKCTNCGAPVNYRPGVLSAHCTYCNTTIAIKQEKKEEKKSSKKKEAEVFDLREGTIVHCKTCSAEYLKDEHSNVSSCSFCGIPISEEDIHEGFYVAPSHYLPFRTTEAQFREQIEAFLKEIKFPSPFKNSKNFSNVTFNRFYLPCWTDDVNVYTDDKELQNPYFKYRNLFIIASDYIDKREYSNNLLPWNRNELVPINEKCLKEEKVLLFSFDSKPSPNSNSIIYHRRKVQFQDFFYYSTDRQKEVGKIKKVSLVLLPIYECLFTYKKKDYCILQNAYKGSLACKEYFDKRPSSFDRGCLISVLVVVISFFIFVLWIIIDDYYSR